MGLESMYALSIMIRVQDQWSNQLGAFGKHLGYTKAQLKTVQDSMKMMGTSSRDIDKVTNSLNKMGRASQLGQLVKDMKSAGLSAPQIATVAAGFNKLANAHERYAKSQKVAKAGAVVTGVGGVMAYGLVKAAEQAAKFQTAIVGAQAAMKLTNKEAARFSNMSMNLGIPTRFSAIETSGILNAMYTAGLTKQQTLNPPIAREYVNFADVQAYRKGENPENAVANAVGMAHLFGVYSTEQLKPFLNQLNAVLMNSHTTISQFGTQFRYVAGQAKSMGMNSEQTLAMTAWLNRMGLSQSRGGTNLQEFLQRSYGHASNAAAQAMYTAGFMTGGKYAPAHYETYKTATGRTGHRLVKGKWVGGHSVFEDAQGNFVGIPQAVAIMQAFDHRFGKDKATENVLLQTIFGTQGMRVAKAMMSGQAGTQYKMVQNEMGHSGSIDQIQAAYNKMMAGQARQFKTTIQDIVTQFGLQLIPILTKFLKTINPLLAAFLKFEQHHPGMVKMAATIALIATAIALIVGPLLMFAGALGMLVNSVALRTGLRILWKPFKLTGKGYDKAGRRVGGMLLRAKGGIGRFFASEAMQTAAGDFKMLGKGAWKGAKWLGKAAIDDIVRLGSGVARLSRAFGSLALSIGRSTIALAANAAKTVALKVAQLAVAAATKIWAGIQAAFNLIMDANPISLIIIGIAALITGIVLLVKHWKTVIDWIKKAWDWYKHLGDRVKWLIAVFAPFIGLPLLIIDKWGAIKTFFSDLWTKYLKPVIDAITNSSIGKWVMQHVLGVNVGSNPIPSAANSIPGGGNTTNHITIHVHDSGNPKETANEVVKQLGKQAGVNNRSRGVYPNKLIGAR